jgi:mannose-6-phosphate isomerase
MEEARKGYAREDEMGIAVTAPNRNYKDRNHKPELMIALGDFYLLHGFKEEQLLKDTLARNPELSFLVQLFDLEGYEGIYKRVMEMPQDEVNQVLAPLVERVMRAYSANSLTKDTENFWAARAVETYCSNGNIDRGIFSIYLFNVLHLEKGEGVFQPAGMPHAYLEGQNIEVMANSDNVLRAGLTDKHIDVPELMKHVTFAATIPRVMAPKDEERRSFVPDAEEFDVEQLFLKHEIELQTTGAEIYFVLKGATTIDSEKEKVELGQGEAAFVAAGAHIKLKSKDAAEVFRVFTK